METASATIESLPAELLYHVFSFLDGPSPSDQRLHDQPGADMLKDARPHAGPGPLKAVSLASRQWRAIALPLLFRNAIWYLDRAELMQIDDHLKQSPSAIPPLSFIHEHKLSPYVRSFTLFVNESSGSAAGAGQDVGLYRRGDGSGHYGYSSEPQSPPSPRRRLVGERDLTYNENSNWLWNLIFEAANPLRFTIIASPRILASLLARKLFLGDEWVFHQSHHVLSLSRGGPKQTRKESTVAASAISSGEQAGGPLDSVSSSPPPPPPPPPSLISPRPSSSSSGPLSRPTSRVPCDLFTIRPWTQLLLNEGSSTRVYKTYEYFYKRPPSILAALLGAESFPNDEPLIPRTIRDLSYVGIFPLSSHFSTLVDFLPHVERLFVQLVPRNNILNDRREMAHLDMDDLWAERNTSYARIMPKLFDDSDDAGNWRYLTVFESGDAADRESWEMAVDYVTMFSTEWAVEREGVFVKKQR